MQSFLALSLGQLVLSLLVSTVVGDSPRLDQDIVVLSDNAVDIDSSQASVYGEWSFKENIMETPNTPSTPDEGLTGILYDLGLACSANASDALPPPSSLDSMPKIALIRRGQCFFSQKLLHAQMDGAIGAIVYDNVSFADDPLANYGMSIASRYNQYNSVLRRYEHWPRIIRKAKEYHAI